MIKYITVPETYLLGARDRIKAALFLMPRDGRGGNEPTPQAQADAALTLINDAIAEGRRQ